ncbi:hypothetical protein BDN71DRAFT_368296 [Pleurotus eryngii]|uniref:Uncharacterized protein n=1 Tax=Pleurotus eryngii TaxID=5323 RepID=A0A9P5ZKB2_PLEER|nr:hypothetical protein BDN71DRAFT_368296 [Pleurotus eryngii]
MTMIFWRLVLFVRLMLKLNPPDPLVASSFLMIIDGSTMARQIASARAATSPKLNNAGTKAAWFKDKSKIVIYDLLHDIELTLIDQMGVHPTSLVFSEVDDVLYFIGGNDILVYVCSLPVPEAPFWLPRPSSRHTDSHNGNYLGARAPSTSKRQPLSYTIILRVPERGSRHP